MIKFLIWLFMGLQEPEAPLSINPNPPPLPGSRKGARRPIKPMLFRQALVREKGSYDLPALIVRPHRQAPPHRQTGPAPSRMNESSKCPIPYNYPRCGFPIALGPVHGDNKTVAQKEDDAEAAAYEALARHYSDPYGRYPESRYCY